MGFLGVLKFMTTVRLESAAEEDSHLSSSLLCSLVRAREHFTAFSLIFGL